METTSDPAQARDTTNICEECGTTFPNPEALERHLRVIHPDLERATDSEKSRDLPPIPPEHRSSRGESKDVPSEPPSSEPMTQPAGRPRRNPETEPMGRTSERSRPEEPAPDPREPRDQKPEPPEVERPPEPEVEPPSPRTPRKGTRTARGTGETTAKPETD
jgi:Zinc finger, C2H2 type